MPQMSPMWWMTLMLLFIFTLYMTMSMLYFNKKFYFKNKNIKKMMMNWKW
uniref:ATP synthase F0 subunit 8 n=1 Tax=Gessius rufidorsus TaxID=1971641 RepID=A0A6C0MDG1_9HEMI|nr:ATP synthase F0 subunit 8 [Gessius sp. 'rufidorsus']